MAIGIKLIYVRISKLINKELIETRLEQVSSSVFGDISYLYAPNHLIPRNLPIPYQFQSSSIILPVSC